MTFKTSNRAGQIALTLGVLLGIAFAVFATGFGLGGRSRSGAAGADLQQGRQRLDARPPPCSFC